MKGGGAPRRGARPGSCCSTRPGRYDRQSRARPPGSVRGPGPGGVFGWPRRSTRYRPTCSPPRSSRPATTGTGFGSRGRSRGPGSGMRGPSTATVALGRRRGSPASRTPLRSREVRRRSAMEGSSCVLVAIDDRIAGAWVLDDRCGPIHLRVIRRSDRRDQAGRDGHGDHPTCRIVGIALGVRPDPVRATRPTRSTPCERRGGRRHDHGRRRVNDARRSPRPTSASRWARGARRRPRPPTWCSWSIVWTASRGDAIAGRSRATR